MAEFDIYQFADRVDELLARQRRLSGANEALQREVETLNQRNAETRRRLQALIARLKALESEAAAVQS